MSSSGHVVVLGDDLLGARLWNNDSIMVPDALVVETQGVLQELHVVDEVLLQNDRVIQVILPPVGHRLAG